jgi:hypothetical protein
MSTRFYKSKKFWYAVGTAVAAIVADYVDVSPEVVIGLIVTGVGLIIGQGWADTGKEAAKVEK